MKKDLKKAGASGITLISLVVTIILLLILAGIAIHLTLSNKGIIKLAKDSAKEYSKQDAKDKLELVLFDMQIDQINNKEYNENEYLTSKIQENNMEVNGDIVTVNGWEFEIDRSVPKIVSIIADEKDLDDSSLRIERIQESDSQVALNIYDIKGGKITQYKIGEADNWTNYTNMIVLDSYQLQRELGITDGKVIVTIKSVDSSGNQIETQKTVRFKQKSYKEEDTIIEGESILACVKNNSLESGNYIFRVTPTTDGKFIDYPIELYNYKDNANYIVNCNTTVSNTKYTGLGNATAEKRMLILKYNQNLTIEENVTLTPTGTTEVINGVTGLCTKKGMLIYCEGTIENKGTITMTAKGTVNQAGENVYLWKNEDESNEFIPETGGAGGARVSRTTDGTTSGKSGANGTVRRTGGGGSGGASRWSSATSYSGAGGTGTSYSGGTGGGSCSSRVGTLSASAGSSNGGAGGNAATKRNNQTTYQAGGGAGNPGGKGSLNNSLTNSYKGADGTGGLLILYANNIINTATISSNGSLGGGNGYHSAGGSSGAGSINIFYSGNYQNSGSITATSGKNNSGGAGGTGSITIGSIATGSFDCQYKNYED